MTPEYLDHIESAKPMPGGDVRWLRYYGTREKRCAVSGDAINKLRKEGGHYAEVGPLEIFELHIDSIAKAVSRKYAANKFNMQGEIVVGRVDL